MIQMSIENEWINERSYNHSAVYCWAQKGTYEYNNIGTWETTEEEL